MQRITDKQLESVVERLNRITNSPLSTYVKDNSGKYIAQIGNYHLSHAYGGVTLHRMHSEGGGVTTPLGCGYTTKRDLYNQLHAFIKGIESQMENN